MKKTAFLVMLICAASVLYAQTRDDILIHIPMPTGGTTAEQQFFQEQFVIETTGAGYTVTDTQRRSDYLLRLEIKANMVTYDDGSEGPAPPEEPQKLLEVRLVRTHDNTEIVKFSFPFDEKEEMYDFNLYLLYQAMANVPMTKLTAQISTDHWRNKWLYVKASYNFTLVGYTANEDRDNREWGPVMNGGTVDYTWIELRDVNKQIAVTSPYGITLGAELQFLNWMSAEAYFKLLTNEIGGSSVVPVFGLGLKFPLKPAKHYMLEPYAIVEFAENTSEYFQNAVPLALGGGAQLGVKGGEMGAFFVDASYTINLGDLHYKRDQNKDVYYSRWTLAICLGYKVGFFNRHPDPAVENKD